MSALAKYVLTHTVRGECKCGHCADKGNTPDPTHGVDMIFFQVSLANVGDDLAEVQDQLTTLAQEHERSFDPFDGKEHSYLELGAWIGDQGIALQFMALATMVGKAKLLTPRTMGMPEDMVMSMAGAGLVGIQS